jgi:ribonuclease VapC
MVVDTSAVLAVFFSEPHADWVADQMQQHAGGLRMSTVNLVETLVLIRDRQPTLAGELEGRLLTSGIHFVAPDVEQARVAAAARLRFPLNLGDCFAYALAKVEEHPILAVDRDFRSVDCPVVLPSD